MRKIDFKISKILSPLLAMLLLVSSIPISTYAATSSGTCGENATWEFDDTTGTLTISGTGDMENYTSSSKPPWDSIKTSIENIVIQDGIINISNRSFFECSALKNVQIPNSVTSIGGSAFSYCRSLSSINLPDSITSIGEFCFWNSPSLKSVTLSNNLTDIPQKAFANTGITSIRIPDGVTSFGMGAFYQCDSLAEINIPDTVTSIGRAAFSDDYSLTTIAIPLSIETIEDLAFSGCNGLQSITVDENNNYYCDIDGVLYDKDATKLIKYPAKKADTTYITPDTLETITEDALENTTTLTDLYLSKNISYINRENLTNALIDNSRTSLKSITVDENNSYYSSQDGVLFNKDKTELILFPAGDTTITEYTIPEGVKTIGSKSFYMAEITNISIPNTVTIIDSSAFYQSKLTELTTPDSVTTINANAFYQCPDLANITFGNGVKYFGYNCFDACPLLTEVVIPASATKLDSYCFRYCKSLKSFTVLNPTCEIVSYQGFYRDTTTFYGFYNSTLQTFAEEKGYTFRVLCSDGTENHSFDSTTNATCDKGGITTYTCSICGYTYDEEADLLGHYFDNYMSNNDATCTEDGTATADCSNGCGETLTIPDEGSATGHSFTDYISNNDATCIENGTATAECDNGCGETDTITEENSALGHSYTETIVEPTCTEQGYTSYSCENCGDSYKADFTDATGHNFDNSKQFCLNNCGEENPDYIASPIEEEPTTAPTPSETTTESTTQKPTESVTEETTAEQEVAPSVTEESPTAVTENTTNHTTNNSENKPPNTTKPETTAAEIANNSKAENSSNKYSGKTQTDYSAYRIVPGFNQIKTAWEKDADLDGYKIYISTSANGGFNQIADIKTDSEQYYIIDNLNSGEMYYVKLVGYVTYNNEIIEMNESKTRAVIVK